MKMRKVFIVWVIITLVVVTAAFAQRPEQRPVGPPPQFMGMGVSNDCTVILPGRGVEESLKCRCFVSPNGFRCMVVPRLIMERMDSMRIGRIDSMMGRRRMSGRMMTDSVRGVWMDSMRARRQGLPRRP